MDHSPYYAFSSSSSPPSPTSPRRDKVILQRQYREKEGECFATLRAIIHKLTGEVLQTRHEILTKAIELLLTFPEMRKSREMGVIYPATPFEPPSPDLNIGYSLPLISWSESLHSTVESGTQTAYCFSHFPGQPDANAALNQGGYRENWLGF